MGISKIKPLTSQYHSVGGSRGRGLLCLAPQLVLFCAGMFGAEVEPCTGLKITGRPSSLLLRPGPARPGPFSVKNFQAGPFQAREC